MEDREEERDIDFSLPEGKGIAETPRRGPVGIRAGALFAEELP